MTVGELAIVVAAVLASAGSAGAGMSVGVQLPTWDSDGQVLSIAREGQSIFLGGDFRYVGPHTGGGAFVHASDASLDQSFPAFDDGQISAAVDDGSGGYFVGGTFTLVGGVQMPYLVHVLADGSLDRNWHAGADGIVEAMVRIGSTLFIGGHFTHIGGADRQGLGALDIGSARATAWQPGETGDVSSMAAIGSTVYIGVSSLYTAAHQILRSGLAAVDDEAGALLPFDPGVGTPTTLAVSGTTLYLGGVSIPAPVQNTEAVAYDTQTGAKKPWSPVFNGPVDQLVVQGGTVFATGNFTLPTPRMAAVSSTTGAPVPGWQIPEDPGVLTVAGPTLYVGTCTPVNQIPHCRLAAYSAATGAPEGPSISLGQSATYAAVANDHVIVGGGFLEAGGLDRVGVAELDARTGAGLLFDAGLPANSEVTALATHAGTLYLGGYFDSVQGQPRTEVAAVDIASGALLPWAPQLSVVDPAGAVPILVKQISATDTTVYFAGQFNRVGAAVRDGLAAVTANGTLLPFDAQLAGYGETIDALLVTPTAVYLGGTFLNAGGVERHRLAALDPLTGAATAWDPSSNGEVKSLATDGDTVYAGGSFTVIGGSSKPSLAGISATTGTATSFAPSFNGNVSAIAAAAGTLFVAGSGAVSGASTQGYLAVDLATGATTPLPSAGSPSGPTAVAVTPDGTWAGFGSGPAAGIGFTAGPVRSGYTSFSVSAAPTSPTGSNGGGGGGGAGGGPLDLATSVSVSPALLAPGGSATFHVAVTDVTKTPATHLHVTVALPAGAVAVSTSADRGQGCKPTATTGVLSCDLDYLAGNPTVGNIVIAVTLPRAGAATLTATSAADQPETDTVNNTASATVQVGTPPAAPAPPPTSLPSPVLKRTSTRSLTGIPHGRTEIFGGSITSNEALRLTLTVTKQGSTKRLPLGRSSSLAGAITRAPTFALMRSVAHRGGYAFRAILNRNGLVKGDRYIVHLRGTTSTARRGRC